MSKTFDLRKIQYELLKIAQKSGFSAQRKGDL